jgi:hypothetical protein
MATKHEKSFVDYDKPYEQNLVGLRGIIYFGIGLFLLIVVTFGLMWAMMNVMEDQAVADKDNKSPLAMGEQERLPPEPRLQSAPGFGVDDQKGRVNLELKAPQSEYRELHKQWEELWANGQKDKNTNTVISLPIKDAKEKFLAESKKTPAANQGKNPLEEARTYVSYSSSGRTRTDRRR